MRALYVRYRANIPTVLFCNYNLHSIVITTSNCKVLFCLLVDLNTIILFHFVLTGKSSLGSCASTGGASSRSHPQPLTTVNITEYIHLNIIIHMIIITMHIRRIVKGRPYCRAVYHFQIEYIYE